MHRTFRAILENSKKQDCSKETEIMMK